MNIGCCDRYILKFRDQRILRKYELDAFLCTAVSPHLHDTEMTQEMKVHQYLSHFDALNSV